MSNIVERLRKGIYPSWDERVMNEAADEIERLRASNAELLAALKDVQRVTDIEMLASLDGAACRSRCNKIARAAIEKAERHE